VYNCFKGGWSTPFVLPGSGKKSLRLHPVLFFPTFFLFWTQVGSEGKTHLASPPSNKTSKKSLPLIYLTPPQIVIYSINQIQSQISHETVFFARMQQSVR
jgi:hypothetical protein